MLGFLEINDFGDLLSSLIFLFFLIIVISGLFGGGKKNNKNDTYTIKKSNVYKNYDSKGRKIK